MASGFIPQSMDQPQEGYHRSHQRRALSCQCQPSSFLVVPTHCQSPTPSGWGSWGFNKRLTPCPGARCQPHGWRRYIWVVGMRGDQEGPPSAAKGKHPQKGECFPLTTRFPLPRQGLGQDTSQYRFRGRLQTRRRRGGGRLTALAGPRHQREQPHAAPPFLPDAAPCVLLDAAPKPHRSIISTPALLGGTEKPPELVMGGVWRRLNGGRGLVQAAAATCSVLCSR